MGAQQAQVLRDLGNGWQECLDEQGVFYFNSVTGESQDAPPSNEYGAGPQEYTQEVPGQPYAQAIPNQPYAQEIPGPAYSQEIPGPAHAQEIPGAAPQPGQKEAAVKMRIGHWSVCEDEHGEFYHNGTTGETFDQPPPALLDLHQRSNSLAQRFAEQNGSACPTPVYQAPHQQQPQVVHQQPHLIQQQPHLIQQQPQVIHQQPHLIQQQPQYIQQQPPQVYQHQTLQSGRHTPQIIGGPKPVQYVTSPPAGQLVQGTSYAQPRLR